MSIDTGVGVSGCRGSVGIVSRSGVEVSSQGSNDEQLQQRSGRREGRTQHDRAHEPAPTAATGGASEHDSGIASAPNYLYIFLSL